MSNCPRRLAPAPASRRSLAAAAGLALLTGALGVGATDAWAAKVYRCEAAGRVTYQQTACNAEPAAAAPTTAAAPVTLRRSASPAPAASAAPRRP